MRTDRTVRSNLAVPHRMGPLAFAAVLAFSLVGLAGLAGLPNTASAAPTPPATTPPTASATFPPPAIDYLSAPRHALVVGNSRYPGAHALRNAESDARLIAARLKQAGYATELLLNANRGALFRAIGALADRMKSGGAAVLYYAGHGMEVDGRNLLLPLGAPLDQPAALAQAGLPVDFLITRLKDSGAHVSLVMLDACRNDPAQSAQGSRYRGAGAAGFAPQRPANGMLVAYSTQPGERALDGSGANSPFALALANWINRPGLPVEDVMKQVMTEVRSSTRDEQRPWVASSLIGDFALVPKPGSTARLVPARVGQTNVDGTAARGTASAGTQPATTVNGAALMQWFQNPEAGAQAELTRQIEREARGVNADDLPRLERQARGGSVLAASVLGTAYRKGFGVGPQATRSTRTALKWFELAAKQGMPYAQNELGEMHYLGHGTPRDAAKAKRYFEDAAAQGSMAARLNLLQVQMESGQFSAEQLRGLVEQTVMPARKP